MSGRLTIVRPGLPVPHSSSDDETMTDADFRARFAAGRALSHVARYREARILVHRLEHVGRPLPLAMALRALSRGPIYIEDVSGRRRPLSVGQLARWAGQVAREPFQAGALVRRMEERVARLESGGRPARLARPVDVSRSPVYLRTDLSFGVRAGGSVGHIAGVLNELGAFTAPPIFLTTDDVPTVSREIEVHAIAPGEAFWNFAELPSLVLNDAVLATAGRALAGRAPAFVYQRYSLNNVAGIELARAHRVPLVVEYNGSEIWMSRHWGRPLKHEALSARIERANLELADLVVVVSRAMEAELVGRNIDRGRILVNFNGVDERRYNPDVDGAAVRERLGLRGKTVIGFIGTFGPRHGAETLARAFVSLLNANPGLRASVRLVMIGDGARRTAAQRIVEDGGVGEAAIFTGLVPQEEGPAHLAACDVLASPHVPNPDGTPFFGSPTKLFEYMAMGKAIVASGLEQIAEVVEHGRDGWLVPPADAEALADGARVLLTDAELRRRLGAAARTRVIERHTWRQHTRRTIDRLREIGAGAACA